MRSARAGILLPLGLLLAGCAATSARTPAAPPGDDARPADMQPTGRAGEAQLPGYLAPEALDPLKVIPPAPQAGDPRDEADRRVFRETRALQGTPRWQMASDDAQSGAARMLQHFACSLDVELTPQQAPNLVRLAQRVSRDSSRAVSKAKDFYKRQRPYNVDAGEICRPREETGNSYDYPSGHATAGWTWGLALALAVPDRATPILARARAYGDSRVVCGAHNASAVSAARLAAGTTVALASATPEFQHDLAAARAEVAALRAAPHATPALPRCETEAALVGQTVPVN